LIITCPNCRTSYRVASDALSAAGRQVQCASCAELWVATPSFPEPQVQFDDPDPDDDELEFRADDDTLFTETDETMLDVAFVEQERGEKPKSPTGPPMRRPRDHGIDGKRVRERTDDLVKRRNSMIRKLPMARFRRAARVALALILVLVLVAAVAYRTEIVRLYPEMNGIYRVVGLGTNVIGLDIGELNTLRTTRDGNPAIVVSAKISNITNRLAFVPNVLVSLLGADRRVIYEWSVTPSVRNILPGDVMSIDTQLTSPPAGVETVQLSFVEGSGRAGQNE
jgi:predicted Zn finger-like uncharacterized protein